MAALLEPSPRAGTGIRDVVDVGDLQKLSDQGRLDSLIVSDLHLGLRGSRSAELARLLPTLRFRRLVLLGDILHDAAFGRLTTDDWALIAALRQLRHRADRPQLWPIVGNHDRACAELLGRLLDRPIAESVAWTDGGRRFLAVHGDLFDRFITQHPRVAGSITAIFGFCQRRLSTQGRWPHLADQFHVRLTDGGRKLADAALAHARRHDADVIFCGHTHQAYEQRQGADGRCARPLAYLNVGAWLGVRPTFGSVTSDGHARVHRFA